MSGDTFVRVAASLSDSQILILLRRAFKKALSKARCSKKCVVLELFSGCGRFSSEVSRLGFAVLSFDIENGEQWDLLRPCVKKLILGWITSGAVLAVWLGTPCTTFSRARRGPPGSSWGPLRSGKALWGLDGLCERDQAKLRVGNACFRVSLNIIRACVRMNVPVYLENPASSMMFQMPPLASLARHPSFYLRC